MKKVLVTGAAGNIGLNVIKYLLSEGKYEITALDLKNKKIYKKLKKYRRRINIIYGDVNDTILMEALVKDHDYIIHLASVIPPFSDLSKNIASIVDYSGTENIIKAINFYNEKCHLIYASTTSLYDKSLSGSIKEKINEDELTSFSYYKYKTENLIKKKLKNYTILRVPLILTDLEKSPIIYNIKKNLYVEVSTSEDAAYAFVRALSFIKDLNKKTYNIGLGEEGRVLFTEILYHILKYYGLSFSYLFGRVCLEKNYLSPILSDSDDLDNCIHYRTDSLYNYYRRLKNKGKKRIGQRIIAKPFLLFHLRKRG